MGFLPDTSIFSSSIYSVCIHWIKDCLVVLSTLSPHMNLNADLLLYLVITFNTSVRWEIVSQTHNYQRIPLTFMHTVIFLETNTGSGLVTILYLTTLYWYSRIWEGKSANTKELELMAVVLQWFHFLWVITGTFPNSLQIGNETTISNSLCF